MTAGTLYAGYAPAGSFTLSIGGRAVPQRPAFGWAAQYATARVRRALALAVSLVPLAVLLELAAWLVLAVARRPATAPAATAAAAVTPSPPAGASREPRPPSRERRWRVLALVVVVVAGVGIAAGARGTPAPVGAPRAPGALVSAPDAESSAWYCTGQSTASGVSPGFVVLTNTTAQAVDGDRHGGDRRRRGRARGGVGPGPRRGGPGLPALSSGSWVAETVTVCRAAGWR